MKAGTATILLLGALASACGSGVGRLKGDDSDLRYADYAGAPIDEFTSFRMSGWTPISRDQVVLWNGVNEAYLIKVWSNCRDLQFVNQIAVTSTTRTISKFEKLVVGDDLCPIEEIRPIDVQQYKADRRARADALKAARSDIEPKADAPPPPQP
jgi:hypothetical protein